MRRGPLLLLALTAAVLPAQAAVHRYALVIGNDAGEDDEARLRFAQTDAARIGEILSDLGGFDSVLVAGASSPRRPPRQAR